MAVLVTRPHPDDETTAASLRARGFEVLLAPMLRFEPVAFHDDADARLRRRHRHQRQCAARHRASPHGQPVAQAAAVRGRRTYRVGRAQRRFRQRDLGGWRCRALARSRARKRQGEGAEESRARCFIWPAPIWRAISPANSASAVLPSSPRRPTGCRRCPACRARSATLSPPTGSRRCCIIRGAARAHSWRRRAPPASKYRRWRSRNAAFPMASPRSSATPGPRRSWWRPRRTKMPCSGRWTVLCARYRAKRVCRIWQPPAAVNEEPIAMVDDSARRH